MRPNSPTDFFILILFNIKVLLILHTKFQPNTPNSCSGENVDFISIAIFSICDHLVFSARLKFYYSEVLELIMLHGKFEIQWFKRMSHMNGLKC